jgi:tetratricopeptide (TPR) repeat protein
MLPSTAFAAQSTTYTYGQNNKGWWVQTQDGFLPDRTVTWLGMSRPEEIAFATGATGATGASGEILDILYIADTGNRRVLLYNVRTDEIAGEITHPEFNTPRGVYITRDGTLYVADAAARCVFIFNSEGEHIQTVGRPESLSFGETEFRPYRVAADVRGNIYIVSEGVYAGIIQLSAQGEFLGFFASNRTLLTWIQVLQDIFFTERQRQSLQDRQPNTFSNVHVDARGIVYSSSMGRGDAMAGNRIKKHDMAGRNMLPEVWSTLFLTSITTDVQGNIYTTDEHGYIMVNAPDGMEIFFFGTGTRVDEDIAGIYSRLMSIAVARDGHIWTLDGDKAFLQSFTPTEYTHEIYLALALFDEGLYREAGDVWKRVLRHNQMSVLAHNGLGRTYLYTQEYALAAREFRLAGNRELYSEAFWEMRNQWLLDNLTYGLIIVIILIVFFTVLKYADRERRVKKAVRSARLRLMEAKYVRHVMFSFSVARHPLDAYYYMKRRERGSVWGAVFMYALLFAAYMFYQTGKAYILQYQEIEDMDFSIVIGGFFALTGLFVVCNYLVTSINDGEGGFLDIFKILAYASFPLTLTLFGITAMTYVITLNEAFLISFAFAAGISYSSALLYLGLQEMHGYSVWNTVKSILFTAAFMLIAVVVVFNLTILFNQFVNFVESFVRELIANVFNLY